MVKHMKLSKLFISGCDAKTEWMLPWFLDTFRKHNKTPIHVFDFGMTEDMVSRYPDIILPLSVKKLSGWFNKPRAIFDALKIADEVCWLDTDCQVLEPIDDIFDRFEANKLSMVEDKPWTKRRGETWHNSGVVGCKAPIPFILYEWVERVQKYPDIGDQEVLHTLLKNGIVRMQHISDLPREYNVLRLDYLDGTQSKKPKINHWTGAKGKEHIRSLM